MHPPAAWPRLEHGDVHIWHFSLDQSPAELDQLRAVLNADESARAARYVFPQHRAWSIAARGMLRQLLGGYLNTDPAALTFDYGPQGKPALRAAPLAFNLAHSDAAAVCAVTLNDPVGVDVEHIRANMDLRLVAQSHFSVQERVVLDAEPEALARRDFFRCWSMKEAYIKGRGGGLSIPLAGFDVPLASRQSLDRPLPVTTRESDPAAHGWYVAELGLGAQLAGAVARQGPDWRVRHIVQRVSDGSGGLVG